MKPILHINLDTSDTDNALSILKRIASIENIKWIGVGKKLIKNSGIQAIIELKKNFPDKQIVVDTDVLGLIQQPKSIIDAGADILQIPGNAPETAIKKFVDEFKRNGLRIMVDATNNASTTEKAKKVDNLNINYILVDYSHLKDVIDSVITPVTVSIDLDKEKAIKALDMGAQAITLTISEKDNIVDIEQTLTEINKKLMNSDNKNTTKETEKTHDEGDYFKELTKRLENIRNTLQKIEQQKRVEEEYQPTIDAAIKKIEQQFREEIEAEKEKIREEREALKREIEKINVGWERLKEAETRLEEKQKKIERENQEKWAKVIHELEEKITKKLEEEKNKHERIPDKTEGGIEEELEEIKKELEEMEEEWDRINEDKKRIEERRLKTIEERKKREAIEDKEKSKKTLYATKKEKLIEKELQELEQEWSEIEEVWNKINEDRREIEEKRREIDEEWNKIDSIKKEIEYKQQLIEQQMREIEKIKTDKITNLTNLVNRINEIKKKELEKLKRIYEEREHLEKKQKSILEAEKRIEAEREKIREEIKKLAEEWYKIKEIKNTWSQRERELKKIAGSAVVDLIKLKSEHEKPKSTDIKETETKENKTEELAKRLIRLVAERGEIKLKDAEKELQVQEYLLKRIINVLEKKSIIETYTPLFGDMVLKRGSSLR